MTILMTIQPTRLTFLALAALAALTLAIPASAQHVPVIGDESARCAKTAVEIYREAAPSIVQVFSFGINPYRVIGRVESKTGSGVFLGDDLVATNFHVVLDATSLAVSIGGIIFEAELVGRDPVFDIAVLRAPGLSAHIEPIAFAPGDGVVIGQPAHVIGYPLGIGKSISTGIVSGVGRVLPLNTLSWLSPFIQTDAPVSGGNSGGALVDDCGYLIGLVTLRSGSPEAENIGFAIPAETLRHELPELIANGKVARPWHGLYGQMVTPIILRLLGAPPTATLFTRGFLVETVEPGSAADKAGIRGGTLPVQWGMQEMILGGDIIVQVNGTEIQSLEDARIVVQELEIGQTVRVKLLRDGMEMEVSAVIEERPILDRDLEAYRHQ
jgi:S1-C subfamily serine protease